MGTPEPIGHDNALPTDITLLHQVVRELVDSLASERERAEQLAHVFISKYADHLPLYRQAQIKDIDALLPYNRHPTTDSNQD